jgi:hypothetical protein
MSYVQLIDTDYVFLHTTIDKNTDPDLLNPSILVAQDTTIQQVIGQYLYQTIMDMVADNTIVTDPSKIQYRTLLNNYIQPSLAHWTVWFALPDIQYRLTNKSILQKGAENMATTGLDELIYLRNNVKHYADFYNQRIREYIINIPSAFPEYFQSVGIDRIRPKRTTYFSGWSSNESLGRKIIPGRGDPSCCDDPSGYPLNF